MSHPCRRDEKRLSTAQLFYEMKVKARRFVQYKLFHLAFSFTHILSRVFSACQLCNFQYGTKKARQLRLENGHCNFCAQYSLPQIHNIIFLIEIGKELDNLLSVRKNLGTL